MPGTAFSVQKDDDGLKWLITAETQDDSLCLPCDIAGIRKDALASCKHLQKILIPRNIRFMEEDAFAGFDKNLYIHCEAASEPETWFREEICLDSFSEDYEMYFEMEVRSWFGKYHYTCDSNDRITYRSPFLPKIIWKSTEFESNK